MTGDPTLDLWSKLASKNSAMAPTAPEPTYPGTKPPKVPTQTVDTERDDWITSLPSQEYLVNGETKRFYTVGSLGKALQRKPTTIRSWESKGWIPQAGFRTPPPRKEQIPGKQAKGKRLYSERQLRFLYEAYKRFYLADPYSADWPGFRRHIKTNYPNS